MTIAAATLARRASFITKDDEGVVPKRGLPVRFFCKRRRQRTSARSEDGVDFIAPKDLPPRRLDSYHRYVRPPYSERIRIGAAVHKDADARVLQGGAASVEILAEEPALRSARAERSNRCGGGSRRRFARNPRKEQRRRDDRDTHRDESEALHFGDSALDP